MPGGAMSVALSKYEPSIASNAKSAWFWRQGRIMLSVMLHCLVRQHQLAMGKEVGSPAMPAVKWFFQVHFSRLTGFVRCMLGGMY